MATIKSPFGDRAFDASVAAEIRSRIAPYFRGMGKCSIIASVADDFCRDAIMVVVDLRTEAKRVTLNLEIDRMQSPVPKIPVQFIADKLVAATFLKNVSLDTRACSVVVW